MLGRFSGRFFLVQHLEEKRGEGEALVAVHPEIAEDAHDKRARAVGDQIPHRIGIACLPWLIIRDMLRKKHVAREFAHFPYRPDRKGKGDRENRDEARAQIKLPFFVLI